MLHGCVAAQQRIFATTAIVTLDNDNTAPRTGRSTCLTRLSCHRGRTLLPPPHEVLSYEQQAIFSNCLATHGSALRGCRCSFRFSSASLVSDRYAFSCWTTYMNTTQQDYGQDYNMHHGPLPEGNKNGLQWPRLPPPESPPLTCGTFTGAVS
jgi:hypothetical protein